MTADVTIRGVGIGLRYAMAARLFEADAPQVRWLEIHPENYVGRGGRFRHVLDQAAERWPLVTHGLTMGFGAVEPTEPGYMAELKRFLHERRVPWHSEHLCFSGSDGVFLHDLLPLPCTEQAVDVAVRRVREARVRLELPVAIENISYYAHPAPPEMDEGELLARVLEESDARLLLDVNNVFVNSVNHGFDPRAYIARLPAERVVQIHVAGHERRPEGVVIDTHGEPVCEDVYSLLEYALERIGEVPVLLERDQNFPPLTDLLDEVRRLEAIYQRATGATWL